MYQYRTLSKLGAIIFFFCYSINNIKNYSIFNTF